MFETNFFVVVAKNKITKVLGQNEVMQQPPEEETVSRTASKTKQKEGGKISKSYFYRSSSSETPREKTFEHIR